MNKSELRWAIINDPLIGTNPASWSHMLFNQSCQYFYRNISYNSYYCIIYSSADYKETENRMNDWVFGQESNRCQFRNIYFNVKRLIGRLFQTISSNWIWNASLLRETPSWSDKVILGTKGRPMTKFVESKKLRAITVKTPKSTLYQRTG